MGWEETLKIGAPMIAAFFLGRFSKRLDRRTDLRDKAVAAEQTRKHAEAVKLEPLVAPVDHIIERLNWYIGMLENCERDRPGLHAVELEKPLRSLQAQWAGIYGGISSQEVLDAWKEIRAENLAHEWEKLTNPTDDTKDQKLDQYEELSRIALERVTGFRAALAKLLPGLQ
jgi:hypothetical protein